MTLPAVQHSEWCIYSGQAERCDGTCTQPQTGDPR